MRPKINIFPSADELAGAIASQFLEISARNSGRDNFALALSGGSTPKILFTLLAQPPYRQSIRWEIFHLFWGDERCVPPDHQESNYGAVRDILLNHIQIPAKNIHRIKGEANPEEEAVRYAGEIKKFVTGGKNGWPIFDWIFLGMGTDGHTASLFPGTTALKVIDRVCTVGNHPETGQKRITLTYPTINHAKRVSFLITGGNKRNLIQQILNEEKAAWRYPAAKIQPSGGILEWFLDNDAASQL